MNVTIEQTLYPDPQAQRPGGRCPVCGGALYGPGFHCIRCGRDEP